MENINQEFIDEDGNYAPAIEETQNIELDNKYLTPEQKELNKNAYLNFEKEQKVNYRIIRFTDSIQYTDEVNAIHSSLVNQRHNYKVFDTANNRESFDYKKFYKENQKQIFDIVKYHNARLDASIKQFNINSSNSSKIVNINIFKQDAIDTLLTKDHLKELEKDGNNLNILLSNNDTLNYNQSYLYSYDKETHAMDINNKNPNIDKLMPTANKLVDKIADNYYKSYNDPKYLHDNQEQYLIININDYTFQHHINKNNEFNYTVSKNIENMVKSSLFAKNMANQDEKLLSKEISDKSNILTSFYDNHKSEDLAITKISFYNYVKINGKTIILDLDEKLTITDKDINKSIANNKLQSVNNNDNQQALSPSEQILTKELKDLNENYKKDVDSILKSQYVGSESLITQDSWDLVTEDQTLSENLYQTNLRSEFDHISNIEDKEYNKSLDKKILLHKTISNYAIYNEGYVSSMQEVVEGDIDIINNDYNKNLKLIKDKYSNQPNTTLIFVTAENEKKSIDNILKDDILSNLQNTDFLENLHKLDTTQDIINNVKRTEDSSVLTANNVIIKKDKIVNPYLEDKQSSSKINILKKQLKELDKTITDLVNDKDVIRLYNNKNAFQNTTVLSSQKKILKLKKDLEALKKDTREKNKYNFFYKQITDKQIKTMDFLMFSRKTITNLNKQEPEKLVPTVIYLDSLVPNKYNKMDKYPINRVQNFCFQKSTIEKLNYPVTPESTDLEYYRYAKEYILGKDDKINEEVTIFNRVRNKESISTDYNKIIQLSSEKQNYKLKDFVDNYDKLFKDYYMKECGIDKEYKAEYLAFDPAVNSLRKLNKDIFDEQDNIKKSNKLNDNTKATIIELQTSIQQYNFNEKRELVSIMTTQIIVESIDNSDKLQKGFNERLATASGKDKLPTEFEKHALGSKNKDQNYKVFNSEETIFYTNSNEFSQLMVNRLQNTQLNLGDIYAVKLEKGVDKIYNIYEKDYHYNFAVKEDIEKDLNLVTESLSNKKIENQLENMKKETDSLTYDEYTPVKNSGLSR